MLRLDRQIYRLERDEVLKGDILKRVDFAEGNNPGRGSSERPLTILTIDDEREVVSCLEDFLIAHGHKVFTALSGEQGLKILREHKVDVVLCDLYMPGMNGWEVCMAIQDTARTNPQKIPVFILITGSADHLSAMSGSVESGAAAIIAKPVNLIQLMEVINGAFRNP
jgi:CheY-like chemotaxis protein